MNRSVAALKTRMDGLVLRQNPDPSVLVDAPWNSVTLHFYTPLATAATRAVIPVSNLKSLLQLQLGAPSGAFNNAQIRVQKIRVWVTGEGDSAGIPRAVSLDVYDIVNVSAADGNSKIIKTVFDVGGKNHYPAVGYQYPVTHQNVVLSADNQLIAGVDYPIGTNITVYIDVLWRFQPPKNPSAVTVQVPSVHSVDDD